MSLSNALFSSVSGLAANSTAISVIGDNIANVNTTGFKERRTEFADILGQSLSSARGFSQTGAGTKVARVSQTFTQGAFESTARSTDLAIEGRGFFALEGGIGTTFTRAGIFNFDNQGVLVDREQLRVQGFSIDPTTNQPSGALGDIVLDLGIAPPQVTSTADLSVNLDSNEQVTGPFDVSNAASTSNFQSRVTVFDSLGNGVSTSLFFTKTAPNAWSWNAGVAPADTTDPVATAGDPYVIAGGGTLTFDASGNLTATTGGPTTFNFTNGAAPGQVINYGFGPVAGVGTGEPTTQYAESSTVNSTQQDGFAPGTLQAISVDPDGVISGTFSNGEIRSVAQVALATFPNVGALTSIGNANFQETRDSGQALVGAPRSGVFGSVRSSTLEGSNVDLSDQFIRLIINQRAFQANTRTVSVANELLANVVQLGQ